MENRQRHRRVHQDDLHFPFVPKLINGVIGSMIGITTTIPMELIFLRKIIGHKNPCDQITEEFRTCIGVSLSSRGYLSLYRSMMNFFVVAPVNAIKMTANDFFVFQLTSTTDPGILIGPQIVAGGLAGTFHLIVATPVEYLKVHIEKADRLVCHARLVGLRVPTQYGLKIAWDLIKSRSLFRMFQGSTSFNICETTFAMIYFPLYEVFYKKYTTYMKLRSLYYYQEPEDDGNTRNKYYIKNYEVKSGFVTASIAGAIAAFLVTPLNVVKDNLAMPHHKRPRPYSGFMDCLLKMYKYDGLLVLFKNCSCRMFSIGLLHGLSQSIYSWALAERFFGNMEAL